MTDEAKALVERLRQVSSVLFDDYADGTYAVEDHATHCYRPYAVNGQAY